MSWARIDDRITTHDKFQSLSDASLGLWTRCLAWCGGALTDGRIPKSKVRQWDSHGRKTAQLVAAGLWEDNPTDYVFHDFLDFNRSRDEVLAGRAEKRSAKGRAGQIGGHRRAAVATRSASGRFESSRPYGSSLSGRLSGPLTSDAVPNGTPHPDPVSRTRVAKATASSAGSREDHDDHPVEAPNRASQAIGDPPSVDGDTGPTAESMRLGRSEMLAAASANPLSTDRPTDFTVCPKCHEGRLRDRSGSKGPFVACANYPDCRYSTDGTLQDYSAQSRPRQLPAADDLTGASFAPIPEEAIARVAELATRLRVPVERRELVGRVA
jgi:hypothetical protein